MARLAQEATLPRWLRAAPRVLLPLAIVGGIAIWYVRVSMTESYSRGWVSPSSTEAHSHGVLTRVPTLATDTFSSAHATYRVDDLWIEQLSRIEYRLYLLRRRILEPRFRLVVLFHSERPTGEYPFFVAGEGIQLMYSDTAGFTDFWSPMVGKDLLYAIIQPPFPDTVRLWLHPGTGPSRRGP